MDVVVVLEFCKGEEVVPIVLLLVDEMSEELFQFLVNSFHLSVSLGVVCCGSSQLDP